MNPNGYTYAPSNNQPFCDGLHKKNSRRRAELVPNYMYNKDGTRTEVKLQVSTCQIAKHSTQPIRFISRIFSENPCYDTDRFTVNLRGCSFATTAFCHGNYCIIIYLTNEFPTSDTTQGFFVVDIHQYSYESQD